LFCLSALPQARPACRDCGAAALGGPAENRFTTFDSLCQTAGCADQGQPQLLVNTANLNLYVRIVDLTFGAPASLTAQVSLTLEQSYNSDDQQPGPLGNGWTFSLGDTITQAADSSWVLRRGSGRIDRFGVAIDPTQFFAITATADVLSRAADGTFTLRNPQTGTVRSFTKDGWLSAIVDLGIPRVALDYNAAGRLTAARVGGAAARAIGFSYTGDGHIAAITDSSGRSVSFGYDGSGNLVQQTNADGSSISFAYDGNGRLVAAGAAAITYNTDGDFTNVASVILADGSARQYGAPGGRQVQVVDAANNLTLYVSTAAGQTQTLTEPGGAVTTYAYDAAGHRTSTTNANGGIVRFDYDGAGNLTAVTDPAQSRWSAAYNGNLLTQFIDADRNTWQFGYDAAGRLTQVTDPYNVNSSLTRSAAGQVTASTDGNGNRNSFQYDSDGVLTKWTDALGGVWSYTFGPTLRVTSRTEPGGATLQGGYDARNRLSSVSAGGNSLNLDYSGAQADGSGRPAVSADQFGNIVQYSYDAATGRLASLTFPGGNSVAYQYDANGRLAKVTDWLGDFALYKYDATGLAASVNSSSGPVTIYQYNTASNLVALVSAGTDGKVIAGYRYNLDANGLRTNANGLSPSTQALSIASGALTYNATNRLTAGAGGQSYRYDASGRLTAIDGPGAASFTYDAFGRLTSAGGTQYAYDVNGLRVERNSGGTVRRFVYDLSGARPRVAMETDGAGNPVAYYIWGLGLLWKVTASGQIYFFHFDGDGNVVALSSPSAGVVNRYRYDPLGKLMASDESVENSFRQGGQTGWVDDGDGLLYADSNYYSPDLRRTLPGTVVLEPPNPAAIVPRFAGPGACFFEGVADCDAAAGRRTR
jgi:YD repeat-containing protein